MGDAGSSWLITLIFYCMAMATLLPWNFFINVNGYWMFKFRTVSNGTNGTSVAADLNQLQVEFMSYLSNAAMIPNVTFLVLNGIIGHRLRMDRRLLISLFMVIVFFTVTLSLAKINTDSWQQEFLAATLTIIVLINVFSATFQGGVFGLAGSFPSQYMNALLSGQGIGGVVVATINIILLAIGGDPVDAAFYCFLFSVIFLIGSLFAFVYLMRTPLYKQCIEGKKSCEIEPSETSALLPDKSDRSELKTVSVTTVLEKIKVEAVTVFVIYIVTLGLFPAVLVLVESANINSSSSGLWETKYFVPVACFLFYNVGDYLGRIITGLGLAPKICSKFALVLSVVRIAFVPLMLLCNIAPGQRHLIPVLMESDTAYIVLMLLLAISNGYLTTIVMVNAPGRVEEHEQQTASNLMVGLLGLGLISGALLSAGLINVL